MVSEYLQIQAAKTKRYFMCIDQDDYAVKINDVPSRGSMNQYDNSLRSVERLAEWCENLKWQNELSLCEHWHLFNVEAYFDVYGWCQL